MHEQKVKEKVEEFIVRNNLLLEEYTDEYDRTRYKITTNEEFAVELASGADYYELYEWITIIRKLK